MARTRSAAPSRSYSAQPAETRATLLRIRWSCAVISSITDAGGNAVFTYKASPSPKGNENVRRECSNPKCGGAFYIRYGAQG